MNVLILIIVQIEIEVNLEAVEEIVVTERIDALFVDSSDFSKVLGIFGKYDLDAFE